jgi:hypothetical protein
MIARALCSFCTGKFRTPQAGDHRAFSGVI